MSRKLRCIPLSILFLVVVTLSFCYAAIIEKDGKTFIVDRHNESWEITQAVSIGFKAKYFEYGIGRYAIRPLDDTSLSESSSFKDDGARVIGVENGSEAHAYLVRKLTRHEIANTQLGDVSIAAAY